MKISPNIIIIVADDLGWGDTGYNGGIDAQELMTNGTPEQIDEDVRRVSSLLGPNLIVSPSHEAILSNVSPENFATHAETIIDLKIV
jgi:uroporphyrinogen decarboxylase